MFECKKYINDRINSSFTCIFITNEGFVVTQGYIHVNYNINEIFRFRCVSVKFIKTTIILFVF